MPTPNGNKSTKKKKKILTIELVVLGSSGVSLCVIKLVCFTSRSSSLESEPTRVLKPMSVPDAVRKWSGTVD